MKRKYILSSGIRTAKLSRLIAKMIDLFIVILLCLLVYPMGIMLAVIYISLCDSINDGQSVGKKIMGFAVISLEDGHPCTPKQSLIRNLPISIPLCFSVIPFWGWILSAILSCALTLLEVYLLFKLDSGHRLGDVMADTTVIANDQNRADIRKRKQSWFDEQKPVPM